MKWFVSFVLVAGLLAGCGDDTKKPGGDSPEANQSSAETPPVEPPQVVKIDLDDPETRNRIIAEAIDEIKLDSRGKQYEIVVYALNQQTPYTGWSRRMHTGIPLRGEKIDYGQIRVLTQFKDGKSVREEEWYYNGQKMNEGDFKDGKRWTAVAWKPNGEKCPETTLVDGNGVWVYYNRDGTEFLRYIYKDGKVVDTKFYFETIAPPP